MTPENNAPPPSNDAGDTATFLKKGSKGILCRKCNHLNRGTATKCSRCDSHLHIKCKKCGGRNERIHDNCHSCGQVLHESAYEKLNDRFFAHKPRVTPMQIVWLLVFAAVAFYFVMMIDDIKFPIFTR
jgi:hypothetical protein